MSFSSPPQFGQCSMSISNTRFSSLVLNLLVNAQQALALVDVQRRVLVSTGVAALGDGVAAGQRTPGVWLRVADNGPGIAAAERTRIFEAFFTTKAEGLGTGMGLSVSRALAREHDGELWLEDTHPGAVFVLNLPMLAAPELRPPRQVWARRRLRRWPVCWWSTTSPRSPS